MKKIISSIIAIIVMIMIAGVCFAASTGTVTGDNLRLRSKASTNSTAIDVLNKGTKVNILSSEDDFYRVSVGNQTGYLSKEYVQTSNSKASNSTSSNSSNTKKSSESSDTSSSNKSSESSDSSSSSKTSKSSDSSSSSETSESSNSSRNKNSGGSNTSSNNNSSESSSSSNSSTNSNSTNTTDSSAKASNTDNADENTDTEENANSSTTKVWSEETINKANTTSLNSKATLYVLPLLNSTKLGELDSGTEVLLISVNGKWAYIQTSSKSGWVNKSLLKNQVVTVPQNY